MRSVASSVFRSKYLGFRGLVFLFAIVLSVSLYYFVVDYYSPEHNVFKFLSGRSQYKFYSGGQTGFYTKIGSLLKQTTESGTESIVVENHPTKGGSENAIKVATSSRAFGMIQEETLRDDDFIREHINYVAPLYMERMHIFIDSDAYTKVKGKSKSTELGTLGISLHSSRALLEFMSEAKVSIGPNGSGTKIIASYIINELEKQARHLKIDMSGMRINPKVKSEDKSVRKRLRLRGNREDKIDILFSMSGAPLESEQDLLNDKRFKLISIDPSFVTHLNTTYGLNLRMTDFNDIYASDQKVATLGSYAFLIASHDVPANGIMNLIRILNDHKSMVYSDVNKRNGHYQLSEFDFYKTYSERYKREFNTILRDVALFIVSVCSTTALAIVFIVWVFSTAKASSIFSDISSVYSDSDDYIPEVNLFDQNLPSPNLRVNQSAIIESLVLKMSELDSLKTRIFRESARGGLTDKDQSYLLVNLENAKKELSRILACRLEWFSRQVHIFSLKDLESYFAAGYLLTEDYERLRIRLGTEVVENDSVV